MKRILVFVITAVGVFSQTVTPGGGSGGDGGGTIGGSVAATVGIAVCGNGTLNQITSVGCTTGLGSVTNFTSGNAAPLFTTSVANSTSTPAQTFTLSNAAQNSIFAGPASGGAGAPSYQLAPTFRGDNITGLPPGGISAIINASMLGNVSGGSATPAVVSLPTTANVLWKGVGVNGQPGASSLVDNATTVSTTEPIVLGSDNVSAGTLNIANGSAAAHTLITSGATTTNTIQGFATVPTTGHILDCTVTSTTCLLHDSGVVTANVVNASAPGIGICHFAGSTQTCTSSAVSLTADVSGILPVSHGGSNCASASITCFNNITGFTASGTTGTTSTNLVFSTNATLINPALGTPASGNASNLSNLPITLTTTGSSGAATWTQGTNTLNIPQYTGGGGSVTTSGTPTTNCLPKFTASAVIGNSGLCDNGTTLSTAETLTFTSGSMNIASFTHGTFLSPNGTSDLSYVEIGTGNNSIFGTDQNQVNMILSSRVDATTKYANPNVFFNVQNPNASTQIASIASIGCEGHYANTSTWTDYDCFIYDQINNKTLFQWASGAPLQLATGPGIDFAVQGNLYADGQFFQLGSGAIRAGTGGLADSNGNPFLQYTATASAVDWFRMVNGATGSPGVVILQAIGGDTNIDMNLQSKGTGALIVPASMKFPGSSTGYTSITSANASATNYSVVLPVPGGGGDNICLQTLANCSGGLTINTSTISGGATNAILYGDGTKLQNEAGVTRTGAGQFTFTKTSLATTPADSIELVNTTAAATGAQQISPSIHLSGQGWKTTSVAASQSVDWIEYVLPVQGSTNPSSDLVFSNAVNGGGFSSQANSVTMYSNGTLSLLGNVANGGSIFDSSGGTVWGIGANGLQLKSTSSGVAWSSTGAYTGTIDAALFRASASVIEASANSSAGTGASLRAASFQSGGTKFTVSGCSISNSTTTGGATAGTFISLTAGTCTATITMNGATGLTATTGWHCGADDQTSVIVPATGLGLIQQTGSTATTATVSGITNSGDVISFNCGGY